MSRLNTVQSRSKVPKEWWCVFVAACLVVGCEEHRRQLHTFEPETDSDTSGAADTDSEIDTDTPIDPLYGPCDEQGGELTAKGCDFYAVEMESEADNWDGIFAVVVSNPSASEPANVAVIGGDQERLYTTSLAPQTLEVINLTCNEELQLAGVSCLDKPRAVLAQGLRKKGAFRITSNIPIVAYQWQPYGTNAHSNDASLLFPTPRLGGHYVAATWAVGQRSQITVAAIEDGTTVSFEVTAEVPNYGGIGPYDAGSTTIPFVLDRADVLTIASELFSPDGLSGTIIKANKPIAVFVGNPCANAPINGGQPQTDEFCCCDHVEDQLLPLEAWGSSAVLARHAPRLDCTYEEDLTLWRIIAGDANMTISFDPPAPEPIGASHHFAVRGEMVQFLSSGDHFASAVLDAPSDPLKPEAAFLAYQLMTSARQTGACAGIDNTHEYGDPYMLFAPPAGQFLKEYVFTTDHVFDYEWDHIIVVREKGTSVHLECRGELPASFFEAVGTTNWEVARVYIDHPTEPTGCQDGVQILSADEPVGVSVVGVSAYQSYGYLAGVGIKPINIE